MLCAGWGSRSRRLQRERAWQFTGAILGVLRLAGEISFFYFITIDVGVGGAVALCPKGLSQELLT